MEKKIYKHIGFYNDIEDIKEYGFLSAEAMVMATHEFTFGAFVHDDDEEECTEDALDSLGAEYSGMYAVVKTIDGSSSHDQYIDVYVFVRTEEQEPPLRLNPAGEEETITVYLSEQATPIAWRAKMDELIENDMTEAEARKWIANASFVMEMYYEKGRGLFLVESEACECTGLIHSPYTCREYKDYED